MNAGIKEIIDLKIVTLIILLIICGSGVLLLINSGKNPSATYAGYGCFILSGFIAVVLFAYYLIKEHYEGLLKHYQNALSDISTARSLAETINKNSLVNEISTQEGGNMLGGEVYSREQSPTASTSPSSPRTNSK